MDPYAELVDRVASGATLVRRWPLRGGVSAHVEALELALPGGGRRRVVLRRHGAAAWKALSADVTAAEFNLLAALSAAGLPVPEPLYLDASGELFGSPCLVMAFVEGAAEIDAATLPGALRQMADYLLRQHALRLELPALPAGEHPAAGALAYVPPDAPIRAALEQLAARAPANAPVLVHGDFWPGNILWRDGRLAAVIDWEDAVLGDPLSDLAGCRLELLWKHGREAAESFTRHYLAGTTIAGADLPVWELYAASAAVAGMGQWGLAPEREADMRAKAERVIADAGREVLRRV